MKKVYYSPNFDPVADAKAIEYASKLLTEDELFTSNSLVTIAVRVLIKQGLLNYKEVEFHYKGQVMTVNEDGSQDYWVDGYCDEVDKFYKILFSV